MKRSNQFILSFAHSAGPARPLVVYPKPYSNSIPLLRRVLGRLQPSGSILLANSQRGYTYVMTFVQL